MYSFGDAVNRIYKNFENEIYVALQKLRLEPNFASAAIQKRGMSIISEIVDRFKMDMANEFTFAISNTYVNSIESAIIDMDSCDIDVCIDFSKYELDYNIDEFIDKINFQSDNMKSKITRLLRIELNNIQRLSKLEKISKKEASQKLLSKMMGNDASFVFSDSMGRKMSAERYFNLLAHAAKISADIDGYSNALVINGCDTVMVNGGSFDGTILSITGSDDDYESLASRMDIFHPNSEATLKIYLSGGEDAI